MGSTENPINPQLGELQDNGGLTKTIALQNGSPAIDAGSNTGHLTFDQRGLGFNRTVGDSTDIGSFEVQDPGGEIPDELVVSTLDDENDGDFSDGDLSLREAIALANERESTDTIVFDSSLNGDTIVLNLGELVIDDSLTINGLGSEQLTIDANEVSRVFNLDDGNSETKIDVAINGLKITGGNASTEELGIFGGGIFNQENLELNDSLVTENTAVAGGGIYNQDAIANIDNSTIADNSISGSASGIANQGSGIANSNSTIEINNSFINDNTNTGIDANESEVTIIDSTVSGNSGLGTGGIRSYRSTINLENSVVSNNSASALGNSGGINSSLNSILNINNSTITDNSGEADNLNDPRARTADAGGILSAGTANITNSAISNNRGVGFGIRNSGDLNITNSTFSGNAGTGILNQSNGFVDISNSTIANNQGTSAAGGIQNENNSVDSVVISSNIIANNSGNADVGGEAFTSGGNNLIGNGNGIDDFVHSDLVGTANNPIDPQLEELQDNGGLTETLALQENSPAINAGSNPNNLETDQRGEGFARTVGDATDIGAYEIQNSGGGEIPDDLVVSTLDDENDGDFSDGDLSLREAIALSNEQEGADTITFDDSLNAGVLTLDSSLGRDFNLNEDVSINGLGQDNLTLDGGFVFNVTADTDVTIDSLSFVGGTIDNSGNLTFSNSTISETANINGSSDFYAIISRQGNTNISSATIRDNDGGSNVGVVIESGTATIESSTITDNDAIAFAQAGVIIGSDATVDISNSTIANNRGRSNGGIENAGIVNISNSTIASNTGGLSAGGINNFGNTGGRVTLTSSILTNNTGSSNIGDVSGDGTYISGGNNLISNGDDAVGFVDGENGDLVGSNGDDPFNPQNELLIDPQLGELQNNGGLTATFALEQGSPAIDAGSNSNNLATDQRGEGFDRTVGEGTDIGAFEVQTIVSDDDIVGTDNRDVLRGTAENDRIFGLDSADFIKGLDGDDFLSGGDGNDFLKGGKGSDTIEGDAGNDLIKGNAGFDILRGGDGHDRIFGGAGVDTIDDGAGNDVVFGGDREDRFLASNPGHDLFKGGKGNDFYVYNINPGAGFFDRDRVLDFNQSEDRIAFRPFVNDLALFDEFADLDTNGSGILDAHDERVQIIGHSTVIDFSDLFGRSPHSDTITLVGSTSLDHSNFRFNETVIGTEFG